MAKQYGIMKQGRGFFLSALLSLVVLQVFTCAAGPELNHTDRIRLGEAGTLASSILDSIWPSSEKVPLAILLITLDYEYLLNHPAPSDDFKFLNHDSLLQSDVYYRPTVYSPNFLATFPAVSGISTIVVGQAKNTTARTSTRWLVTLLHEHFHQLQTSQPGYYEAVNSLDLHDGDQTGMWMLNYAFPYDSLPISRQFIKLTSSLRTAVFSRGSDRFQRDVETYLSERKQFRDLLSDKDYRYFAFQLWQEGFARYTEYICALKAALNSPLSYAFRNLDDFVALENVAKEILHDSMEELQDPVLPELRRVAFYSVGFGEGLLLDDIRPDWRHDYFSRRFDTIDLFPAELLER